MTPEPASPAAAPLLLASPLAAPAPPSKEREPSAGAAPGDVDAELGETMLRKEPRAD